MTGTPARTPDRRRAHAVSKGMEHIQALFFESAQFPGRLHGQSRCMGRFKGLGESLCGCQKGAMEVVGLLRASV